MASQDLQFPQWEQRARWMSRSLSFWIHLLGGLSWILHHGNHCGNLWGLIIGDQKEVEKRCSQSWWITFLFVSVPMWLYLASANLANGLYWQWNLFCDCTQAGKQIYSPFQLLSVAPSSVRTQRAWPENLGSPGPILLPRVKPALLTTCWA